MSEEDQTLMGMQADVEKILQIVHRYSRYPKAANHDFGMTKHRYETFDMDKFERDRRVVRFMWSKLPERYQKHGNPFENGKLEGIVEISQKKMATKKDTREKCTLNQKNAFQDHLNSKFKKELEVTPDAMGYFIVTYGGNGDWSHLRLPDMPHVVFELRAFPAFRCIALKPEYYHQYEAGQTAAIDPRILSGRTIEIPSLRTCYEAVLRPDEGKLKNVGAAHSALTDAYMTLELFIASYQFMLAHRRVFEDYGFIEMDGPAFMSVIEKQVWPKEGVPMVKGDQNMMKARIKARMTERACRLDEISKKEGKSGGLMHDDCGCVHKEDAWTTMRRPKAFHRRITVAKFMEGMFNPIGVEQGLAEVQKLVVPNIEPIVLSEGSTDTARSVDALEEFKKKTYKRIRRRWTTILRKEETEGARGKEADDEEEGALNARQMYQFMAKTSVNVARMDSPIGSIDSEGVSLAGSSIFPTSMYDTFSEDDPFDEDELNEKENEAKTKETEAKTQEEKFKETDALLDEMDNIAVALLEPQTVQSVLTPMDVQEVLSGLGGDGVLDQSVDEGDVVQIHANESIEESDEVEELGKRKRPASSTAIEGQPKLKAQTPDRP
jgi:hypothetical protein